MKVSLADGSHICEVFEQFGRKFEIKVRHILPRIIVARSKLSPITDDAEREVCGLKPYAEMYANLKPVA